MDEQHHSPQSYWESSRHPMRWLRYGQRRAAFVLLLVLTLGVMAGLRLSDVPLHTEEAPFGILSFEFPRDVAEARRMIASWSPSARINAGFSLGFDYLFMVLYPLAIALGCVLVTGAGFRGARVRALGTVMAWLPLAAGLLDAVENLALIKLLFGSTSEVWPVVARWCAGPKFALVGVSLLFLLVGTGMVVKRRLLGR